MSNIDEINSKMNQLNNSETELGEYIHKSKLSLVKDIIHIMETKFLDESKLLVESIKHHFWGEKPTTSKLGYALSNSKHYFDGMDTSLPLEINELIHALSRLGFEYTTYVFNHTHYDNYNGQGYFFRRS